MEPARLVVKHTFLEFENRGEPPSFNFRAGRRGSDSRIQYNASYPFYPAKVGDDIVGKGMGSLWTPETTASSINSAPIDDDSELQRDLSSLFSGSRRSSLFGDVELQQQDGGRRNSVASIMTDLDNEQDDILNAACMPVTCDSGQSVEQNPFTTTPSPYNQMAPVLLSTAPQGCPFEQSPNMNWSSPAPYPIQVSTWVGNSFPRDMHNVANTAPRTKRPVPFIKRTAADNRRGWQCEKAVPVHAAPPATSIRKEAGWTTVMLRNLPEGFTRMMLCKMCDREGFAGLYDFLYMPINFRTETSFGYAFVNLAQPADAKRCYEHFQGFTRWEIPSDKVCEVTWSKMYQGLAAHVERYRNSPVMHDAVPDDYRPAVFKKGARIPFPLPTKKLRMPRIRRMLNDGTAADGDNDLVGEESLDPIKVTLSFW